MIIYTDTLDYRFYIAHFIVLAISFILAAICTWGKK